MNIGSYSTDWLPLLSSAKRWQGLLRRTERRQPFPQIHP